ncbi:MAG: DHH family phosphoesterase [Candidatus Omnitrophica bacterium]|nr:DHH family phosphoesterase [Candidatus Omnitrophota bacterium]
MPSHWQVSPAQPERAATLGEALGVHPLTAQLLLNRGIADRAEAARFLEPDLARLADPYALPDMARGVERLRRAVRRGEPILIFSDSDVDGLSASVILYEALRALGARVHARASNRIEDGYGLPRAVAQRLSRSSAKLLVLVDCGTNQPDEVASLAARGIDTIIVDHHVPLRGWANPYALINPHREHGQGRDLCSGGLAFKLAQALLAEDEPGRVEEYLDLAALATLADCSQLVGDSRVLVAKGLARIVSSQRQGMQRLCEATGTTSPDPDQIVRRLVPRLNASGRLGDSAAVWHLLHSGEPDRLEEWLAQAGEAHATTKGLHRQIMAEALEQVSRLHFKDQFVMVVSRSGWHQGLMGPLAAQLSQQYGRPAIAIAMDEQQGTGSGRSVPLFNLLDALRACERMLVRFGGHAQACGLTVDRGRLEPFRAQINEEARRILGREGLVRTRMVDLELPLERVERRWVDETERLAPFGYGNPRPTVLIRRVRLERATPRTAVLSDGHAGMAAKGRFAELLVGGWYDVVASPAVNGGALTLSVSDVRGAEEPSEPVRSAGTPYTHAPA